jgi:hypothetical protein
LTYFQISLRTESNRTAQCAALVRALSPYVPAAEALSIVRALPVLVLGKQVDWSEGSFYRDLVAGFRHVIVEPAQRTWRECGWVPIGWGAQEAIEDEELDGRVSEIARAARLVRENDEPIRWYRWFEGIGDTSGECRIVTLREHRNGLLSRDTRIVGREDNLPGWILLDSTTERHDTWSASEVYSVSKKALLWDASFPTPMRVAAATSFLELGEGELYRCSARASSLFDKAEIQFLGAMGMRTPDKL